MCVPLGQRASRRLLSCVHSAPGVSASGCPRGGWTAVTCLQEGRPDGLHEMVPHTQFLLPTTGS